jgi:hypothetical protein
MGFEDGVVIDGLRPTCSFADETVPHCSVTDSTSDEHRVSSASGLITANDLAKFIRPGEAYVEDTD